MDNCRLRHDWLHLWPCRFSEININIHLAAFKRPEDLLQCHREQLPHPFALYKISGKKPAWRVILPLPTPIAGIRVKRWQWKTVTRSSFLLTVYPAELKSYSRGPDVASYLSGNASSFLLIEGITCLMFTYRKSTVRILSMLMHLISINF